MQAHSFTSANPAQDPTSKISSSCLLPFKSKPRVWIRKASADITPRLIENLGVAATLTQYHVPKEDLPKVAELALGRSGDPLHLKVVKLLENLYD